MSTTIIHGDCLEELKKLEDNSVDAVVCDPPYGLSNTKPQQVADVLKAWVTGDTEAAPTTKGGFMNASWDSFVPPPAVWEECMRVLKPGGHMAVFAGARTQDLMGLSIRLAGFEIRDTLGWIYGSGMPKSHNVSKAIDRAAGKLAPESTGFTVAGYSHSPDKLQHTAPSRGYVPPKPVTDGAKQWDGWGTSLKPAIEPILLCRKPLDGTVASNVLAHGVGGLNIDACRVGIDDGERDVIDSRSGASSNNKSVTCYGDGLGQRKEEGLFKSHAAGRFPANVLLDEHAAKEMDKQSGPAGAHGESRGGGTRGMLGWQSDNRQTTNIGVGGASRFFPVFKYQAKAPKKERPVIEREDGTKIQHNTVKPLALMEWLVSLIVPPGGVVLDPFAGSGTTLQAALNKGFTPIGIEQDADYIKLIEQRLGESNVKKAS